MSKYEDTSPIDVDTGEHLRRVHVPRNLLCRRSTLFAVCSPQWREDDDKIIGLPENRAFYFSMYLHILHTETVCVEDEDDDPVWVQNDG